MSRTIAEACSATAFERLYQTAEDPWHFADSDYEQLRYRATLDALARPRYGSAFEPGCSIGILTECLAERCDHVLATDFAPSAVERARARCARFANVTIRQHDLSTRIPRGPFDLIVLSEIGYYFSEPVLLTIARSLAAQMQAGGEMMAVHWLGDSADHVLHGNRVHELLLDKMPLRWRAGFQHTQFRLDSWVAT